MDYIVFDYETHYDQDYSLKKIPTHQYIRDERFQTLGVSWYRASWRDRQGPGWIAGAESAKAQVQAFDPLLPWVGHNLAFDASVALWHHISPHRQPRQPVLWLDTMLMARYAIAQGILPPDIRTGLAALAEHYGLDAKGDTAAAVDAGGDELAAYAKHDVYLTDQILRRLLPHIPKFEMQLMDLHIRMTADPVLRLDTDLCHAEIAANTMDEGIKKAVGSAEKFAAALRAAGIAPETKESPRTGKQTYAFAKTDPFMQGLQTHSDPRVRKLAELRLQSKSNLAKNRAERFLAIGAPFPVPLLYYGAHTGRASGLDKLNLQNLPRGGRLRRALKAPPGHKLVIVDSGQIEVRVLAWLAGAESLLEACRAFDAGEGPDIYVAFGSRNLYGCAPEDVTKDQRTHAKPVVLGAGFGQGWRGLQVYAQQVFGVEMSEHQAQASVEAYRRAYPQVVRYWDRAVDEISRTGEQVLPNGRKLTYPDLRRRGRDLYFDRHQIFSKQYVGKRDEIKLWHGLAVENAVQATARDVVMWQTLQLAQRYRVVLSVHDEAVLCVPEDQAEQALTDALEAFGTAPPWAPGLPVAGEGVISDDYGAKP